MTLSLLIGMAIAVSVGGVVAAGLAANRYQVSNKLYLTAQRDERAEQVRRHKNGNITYVIWQGERRCDVTVRHVAPHNDTRSEQWLLSMSLVPALKGTTLTLSHAGYLSILRDEAGFPDVQIGDKTFDLDFDIKSTTPERVKRLLSDASLRDALREFFIDRRREIQISLDGHGHVDYAFVTPGIGPPTRDDITAALAQLCDRLAHHAAELPLAALPPAKNAAGNVAARTASGSPVGFGSRTDK